MKKKSTIEKWRDWKVPFQPDNSVPWDGPNNDEQKIFSTRRWNPTTQKFDDGDQINWQPNLPFKAALKFVKMFHYAQGSTHAEFMNMETGGTYIMRHGDLEECLKNGVIIHGVVVGEWRFHRHSRRYSVVPVQFLSSLDMEKTK